jgi:hypothetical protein
VTVVLGVDVNDYVCGLNHLVYETALEVPQQVLIFWCEDSILAVRATEASGDAVDVRRTRQ